MDKILDIGEHDDPRLHPNFPLTESEYEALEVRPLIEMLIEDIEKNPAILTDNPPFVRRVAYMLLDKGGANALWLDFNRGAAARWAKVPEMSLAVLFDLQASDKLTPEIVEQSVWRKLGINPY